MPTKIKKVERQYPMYAVRLSNEQKAHLNEVVEKTRDRLNVKLKPTEPRWLKNDIVYAAILLGLPLVKGKPKV